MDQFRGAYQQGLLAEGVDPNSFDPYGLAATGLLFAPGAGVADLTGNAPDPSRPGQMLPSFYENISGGNYLDAGLQALGGAGDAVQMMGAAFPPALAVGAAMKAPRGIRAFHGSPYDFERFDISKIGTGEGAQAYGHGLYFAENEDIAKSYRDTLSYDKRNSVKYDGERVRNLRFEDTTGADDVRENILDDIAGEMSFFDQKPENVIKRKIKALEADVARPITKTGDQEIDDIEEYIRLSNIKRLEAYKKIDPNKFTRGSMYEVNIDADPSDMIDYDLPLSQQPKVLKGIDDAHGDPEIIIAQAGLDPETATGGQLVHALSGFGQGVEGQKAASDWLAKAGVKGIKFYSSNSRNVAGGELIDVIKDADGFKAKVAVDNRAGGLGGKGRVVTTSAPYKTEQEARGWAEQATKNQERNYVVFDDATIEIMRKYGLLAPLVGAGTVAAVSDMGEDNQGIMY